MTFCGGSHSRTSSCAPRPVTGQESNVAQLLFSVLSLGSNLTGQAGKFQGKVISVLQCIHALVSIERQMRKFTLIHSTQHTLLARLSAINKGDNTILPAGSLDFHPNDYVSPSVRAGLRMKEKCSMTEGQQAHAVRSLGRAPLGARCSRDPRRTPTRSAAWGRASWGARCSRAP